jgi:N-methylhydantoinase B/oxoprolinase/acetone carboxylase alpha subunit
VRARAIAILQNDPYACSGAISHLNDFMILVPIFMILVPIFHEGDLVGFTSMFEHRRSPYSYEKRSTPSK